MSNAENFLTRYLDAWRTVDADVVRSIFAPDAIYRGRAYDTEPDEGIDAIVAMWDDEQDAPGTWSYEGGVIEMETADAAVIRGTTSYTEGPKQGVYDNLWLVRFDGAGRATEFWDWWVERKH
ncbi:MAG: nuclear transport factor 2 family protein [Microbacterium sp.]